MQEETVTIGTDTYMYVLESGLKQWPMATSYWVVKQCNCRLGSLLAGVQPSWPRIKVPGRSATYIHLGTYLFYSLALLRLQERSGTNT